LTPADDDAAARIARVMRERRADREAKGHYRLPSAGSVFKNDRSLGAPTGALLDRLGLRGRRIGDAMISPWHANIFVNAGSATAADMRELIELAMREARERLGIELEPEVLMVGEF
jgi:UDP-N-acetylmuramate dehydrogenase